MSLSVSRRGLLAGLGGLALAAEAARTAQGQEKGKEDSMGYFAYVGCRTTRERNARGDGIAVYRVEDGHWTKVQLVGGLLNPSYLAFDRSKRFLYTVHGDSSEVSAFRIEAKTGQLRLLNQQSCQGKNPVHLTVDPSNKFLVVANHLTMDQYVSNVAVLPRNSDGSLGAVSDLVPLTGQIGPHRVEQPFAKPHQIAFDPAERFIAVPDKGCDLVRGFTLDATGMLHAIAPAPPVARPGAGPRHIAFHPSAAYAYVINELDSTLVAHRYDAGNGKLTPFQRVSSVPESFTGYSTGSEIAVSQDGHFVYASNRGDDSIGAFGVDAATGGLTALGWVPSAGKTPRFFALTANGGSLYAANEDGDTVTGFAVDKKTGRLTETGIAVHTGSPTCIIFSDLH